MGWHQLDWRRKFLDSSPDIPTMESWTGSWISPKRASLWKGFIRTPLTGWDKGATMYLLHPWGDEAIQKAESVWLLKELQIQTDYRLASSPILKRKQKLYDKETHLDALKQDTKVVSPLSKCWVWGNNNRRNGYQQGPCWRWRHDKRERKQGTNGQAGPVTVSAQGECMHAPTEGPNSEKRGGKMHVTENPTEWTPSLLGIIRGYTF